MASSLLVNVRIKLKINNTFLLNILLTNHKQFSGTNGSDKAGNRIWPFRKWPYSTEERTRSASTYLVRALSLGCKYEEFVNGFLKMSVLFFTYLTFLKGFKNVWNPVDKYLSAFVFRYELILESIDFENSRNTDMFW